MMTVLTPSRVKVFWAAAHGASISPAITENSHRSIGILLPARRCVRQDHLTTEFPETGVKLL
jgi:hypothetical protein